MNNLMINTKWDRTTAFTLYEFLARHRVSYNTLQRCAEHVQVELPNDRTKVEYLLGNIECQDKDITAAMSNIQINDRTNVIHQDFERALVLLLPTDTANKGEGAKRNAAQISEIRSSTSSGKCSKKSILYKSNFGKTRVDFWYYESKEYNKLTQEERMR